MPQNSTLNGGGVITCREVSPGLDAPRMAGSFSHLRCVQSRTHRTCKYVWFLSHAISVKSTEEFTHLHFSIKFLVWIRDILAANILRKQTNLSLDCSSASNYQLTAVSCTIPSWRKILLGCGESGVGSEWIVRDISMEGRLLLKESK